MQNLNFIYFYKNPNNNSINMYIQLKYIIVVFKSWLIFLKIGGARLCKNILKKFREDKEEKGGKDYAKYSIFIFYNLIYFIDMYYF